MFYSHTFLARKGPLGTVWCAAHLQHKLKKSHYVSTNVPSTVERIMYPEVPIALRMSGHLLLGVVRIYSNKLTIFMKTAMVFNSFFTSYGQINSGVRIFRCEDSHLKSKDEITLSEQIPTGQDEYIVIRVDEYDFRASSFIEDDSRSGPVPMEEDDATAGSEYPSPSNKLAADDGNIGNSSPQDLPSIEIMRDARHGFDFNNSPILPDRVEPDKFLEEQINKDKETCTPVTEGVLLPDDRFSSPQNHEEQHSTRHLDSPMLFVHQSPEMEIQPTPPVAQRIVKKRKRKQYFDKSPVLSNKHVKKALDDTSDTRRNRRNCPLSSLAIFKQNMRLQLKKNGLTCQPCVTGCCPALLSLYEEGNISVHHMVTTEKTPQETVDQALSPSHDSDREIEVLRNNEGASPDRFMPSFSKAVPSPHGRSYFTPENSSLGFQSERLETTEGDGALPTSDMGTSPRDLDSEMRTPDTFYGKGLPERTALSDIPELVSSAEDLGFLEKMTILLLTESKTCCLSSFLCVLIGSQGTPEFGIFSYNQGTPELQALSSRTRAVAQYLKKQSSITPTSGNSEESSEDLSLNKILEGKPKKICARLFYETLVLKNYGLVDVHQENPYDNISLKVTPKLSKGQFSS
ncbi:UNVERIFIED_CONTAM: Sister chromatid cohesion 1 protein 3 [Sesamum calycinum]|uniref:Sister chromatid cohesion 1 protein 3 n=1 Tax=Sesamum calycinum TaxID=2727403 RepID=A0AAW2SWP3_9LAMI